MKKLALFTIFILAITTVLLVACGSTSNPTSTNPNTIRAVGGTFALSSLSIRKGSTITFVDDPNNPALHILTIGQNGQDEAQRGAPDFGGTAGHTIQGGDSWITPPWNTAGTYHVTCTVHPGMNLTVIVTN